MLAEIRIKDFAIIDTLTVSLGAGFNVLSGETGAGKSIIVGALGLLLGERGRAEDVRSGCQRAIVEGSFDSAQAPGLRAFLREHGLGGDDDAVVLRREVQASGRGRAWVNGFAVNLAALADAGRQLASIHGQHEAQSLLDTDSQRDMLDEYAEARSRASTVTALFRDLARIDRDIAEVAAARAKSERRSAELGRLVAEISAAKLQDGEEERLDEEAVRLEHAVELSSLASAGLETLNGEDGGVLDAVAKLRRTVEALSRIDGSARRIGESVEGAEVVLGELARDLEDYSGRIEVDPERLARINERRLVIFRLTRKYGGSIAETLATLEAAQLELAGAGSVEGRLAALREERQSAQKVFDDEVKELTRMRVAGARKLSALITERLPPLGMPDAELHVSVLPHPAPDATGAEGVEFLVRLNAGHERRELAKVASGGELSRIMLAIKSVLAQVDRIPSLVFDEVDAGIGGETALHVGDALRELAEHHQILVITHLPQIAARAHSHLIVRKLDRNGVATADVESVEGGEREAEIARMLAGDPASKTGRKHARELLDSARK